MLKRKADARVAQRHPKWIVYLPLQDKVNSCVSSSSSSSNSSSSSGSSSSNTQYLISFLNWRVFKQLTNGNPRLLYNHTKIIWLELCIILQECSSTLLQSE